MYILAETVSQFVIPAPSILRRLGAPTLLHDTPPVAPHSLFKSNIGPASRSTHGWLLTSPAHLSPFPSFFPLTSHLHSSPMESATSRIFFQPFAFEPAVPAAQTAPPPPHLFTRQTPESSRNPASPRHWVRHPLQVLPVPCSPDHPGMQSQFSQAWGSTRAGAVSQASGTPVLGTGLGRRYHLRVFWMETSWTWPVLGITRVPFRTCLTLGRPLPFPEPVSPPLQQAPSGLAPMYELLSHRRTGGGPYAAAPTLTGTHPSPRS